jgi:acyl dehydratase
MRRTYARIALSPLRLRRPDELPSRELSETVTAGRDHLAAYDRVCGFPLRDELPPTFVHVLAFPLGLELMAAADFPFGPLGLVHVANRIEVLRPLRAGEPIGLHVRATDLRPHDRGRQFDIVAEATTAGETAWRGRSTYLHRERTPAGDAPRPGDRSGGAPPPSAIWDVPGDVGRRYARVSGDRNPIHLHRLTARAFGQKAPIAHGMWTKARCLAAVESSLPDEYAVEVRFKLPLRLPGRVAFSFRDGEIAVHDARSGRPHLTGSVAG